MSEEETKGEKGLKEQGFFYKGTEFTLGIASLAAIVLSFIPGANLIGAGIQAAITLVQTGMDLFTKGPKKAALTFITGAAFTALCCIPFLGGAAKAAGLVAKEANAAAHASEEIGLLGKAFAGVKNLFKPVGNFFKWAGDKISELVDKIPGFRKHLKGTEFITKKGTRDFMRANPESLVSKAGVALNHGWTRTGAEVGLMATGVGLGMVGDNTTPPNVLVNPDLYSSNKANEDGPDGKWTKRIDAERAAGHDAPSVA